MADRGPVRALKVKVNNFPNPGFMQQLLLTRATDGSTYTVDIHDRALPTCKHILVIITAPDTKKTNILWVNPNRTLGHGGPARFTLPAELSRRRCLHLYAYGLHPNPKLQSHEVWCYNHIELTGTETSYSICLECMSPTLSLLDITSEKTFPLQLDKAQTQVSALPGAAQTSGASCLVICKQRRPSRLRLTFRTPAEGRLNNFHLSLPSRSYVEVKVLVLQSLHASDNLLVYNMVSASTTESFCTYLSKEDITTLMEMAQKHRAKSKVKEFPLSHFFRNRWNSYFEDILGKGGFMEKYDKDNNGDPHSPVNGNIKGLFFSPALDFRTRKPPYFSLFGEWRLHVPAHILFHKATNLYFADFYCHNETHYVTLVITSIGSEEDCFCAKRLVKLDPYTNRFLFKVRSGSKAMTETVITSLCVNTIVEVFYTESLDIIALMTSHGRHQVYFTQCQIMGAGHSKPTGIPKRSGCPTCNLPWQS